MNIAEALFKKCSDSLFNNKKFYSWIINEMSFNNSFDVNYIDLFIPNIQVAQ